MKSLISLAVGTLAVGLMSTASAQPPIAVPLNFALTVYVQNEDKTNAAATEVTSSISEFKINNTTLEELITTSSTYSGGYATGYPSGSFLGIDTNGDVGVLMYLADGSVTNLDDYTAGSFITFTNMSVSIGVALTNGAASKTDLTALTVSVTTDNATFAVSGFGEAKTGRGRITAVVAGTGKQAVSVGLSVAVTGGGQFLNPRDTSGAAGGTIDNAVFRGGISGSAKRTVAVSTD